ncbi:MAG: T9SS type A sorting domain-containing protein [Candidatus Latescibacteria bacterium]|nr:T9SS type A sorting domain-containing protein [Candidatus Latescibacterota bacterium]
MQLGNLPAGSAILYVVVLSAPGSDDVIFPQGTALPKMVIGPTGELVPTGVVQIPGANGRFTTNTAPDSQSPVILAGPTVISNSNDQLVIQWETDELSTSQVDFGTDSSLGNTVTTSDPVTLHQVTLPNLNVATSYTYTVSSIDPSSNPPTTSSPAVGVTSLVADTTPPTIDEASIAETPSDVATIIQWSTGEAANSEIQYGISADSLTQSALDASPVTSHSMTLTGLAASTQYFYRVLATDASGNGPSQSATGTFTTEGAPNTGAPAISEVSATALATSNGVSIIFNWTTDILATSLVDYDTQSSLATKQAVGDNTPTRTHSLTVGGLSLSTTYHYRVGSNNAFDAQGTAILSPVSGSPAATKDTPSAIDSNAPTTPTNVTAKPGDDAVSLSWTESSDTDSGVKGYNISRGGTEIASNVATISYVDNNASNGNAVTYTVVATDLAGNISALSTATSSVTPAVDQVPSKPTVSATSDTVSLKPNLIADNATAVSGDATRATLTYEFQVSSDIAFSTIAASKTGITEGSVTNPTHWQVTDPGQTDEIALADGTKYWWRVRANDGFFNGVWSDTESFVTSVSKPLSVEVSALAAESDKGVVVLTWSVGRVEPALAGFHVLRSIIEDGDYVRLTNDLIAVDGIFEYRDGAVTVNQQYFYIIEANLANGQTDRFGPISLRVDAPGTFALRQNAPNPFNPATTIRFDLPKPVTVTLIVYNILGQEVIRLINNESMEAGFHEINWNGQNRSGRYTASGIYMYRIEAGAFSKARKMLLLK